MKHCRLTRKFQDYENSLISMVTSTPLNTHSLGESWVLKPEFSNDSSFIQEFYFIPWRMGGLFSSEKHQTKLDNKREDLQQLVGDSPRIEITSFTNWGENIKYEQILSCRPTRLADVQVRSFNLKHFWWLARVILLGFLPKNFEDGGDLWMITT